MNSSPSPMQLQPSARRRPAPALTLRSVRRFTISALESALLLCCFPPPAARAQSVFVPEGDPLVSLDDVLGNASGIAVDADDHVFVADPINHAIRKYLPDGSPATVIGQIGRAGRVDGTAAQARFSGPGRLCYDGAGGILVLDNSTYLRRVDGATLTVSTLANLANGVDGTQMYDVTLGTFQNSGTLNNLWVGNCGGSHWGCVRRRPDPHPALLTAR